VSHWEPVRDAARRIAATEVRVTLEQRAQALGCVLRAEDMEPETWRLVEVSQTAGAADYLRALHTLYISDQQAIRPCYAGVRCGGHPRGALPPVALSRMASPAWLTSRRQATAFTQLANITGNPAMSVPLHWHTVECRGGRLMSMFQFLPANPKRKNSSTRRFQISGCSQKAACPAAGTLTI
jgi:amidase